MEWVVARDIAARAAVRAPAQPVVRPLADALGHVLAAPLTALTDLPSFDTSAMDGWAVAGPGPWRVAAGGSAVLAGHATAGPLSDGHAVRIATGARVPSGATAVLRSEHGVFDQDRDPEPGPVPGRGADQRWDRAPDQDRDPDQDSDQDCGPDQGSDQDRDQDCGPDRGQGQDRGQDRDRGRAVAGKDGGDAGLRPGADVPGAGLLRADRAHPVLQGQDIRPRGQECRTGDVLLPAGAVVTPAVLGLAAAAGYDRLATAARPRVEVLVLGDELLTSGLPRDGRIRDALGPMLGPWLSALGAELVASRHVTDDADALYEAVSGSTADLVITTGGTASGPVDHVHPTLRRVGAELLVDGVAVRPGHPMLLARLAPGRHLVGLPGNPLAAVSGLLTLAEPLLCGLTGRGEAALRTARLAAPVSGHPRDTRLVPVVQGGGRGGSGQWGERAATGRRGDPGGSEAVPLRFNGPAMLRGVAAADSVAVIPPGGADHGAEVETLGLPWATRTAPVTSSFEWTGLAEAGTAATDPAAAPSTGESA
ncbi:molybdopterin molybdotransferase MoeA [Streptomyces sp. NPDC018031]|uniref:molybdopterin molybdotransferase MoeA n=1 Tax=Streptomyces sp. NPDC018031 TaxID=3365033 RepID=UPI00379989D7